MKFCTRDEDEDDDNVNRECGKNSDNEEGNSAQVVVGDHWLNEQSRYTSNCIPVADECYYRIEISGVRIWKNTRILRYQRRLRICAKDAIWQAQDVNEEMLEGGQVGEELYESREGVLPESSYMQCEKSDKILIEKKVFNKHVHSGRGVKVQKILIGRAVELSLEKIATGVVKAYNLNDQHPTIFGKSVDDMTLREVLLNPGLSRRQKQGDTIGRNIIKAHREKSCLYGIGKMYKVHKR